MKLVLGKEFPTAPPKGFFLTKIFHPNVSQQGEICVNTLKKDWKPDLGIKHILLVTRIENLSSVDVNHPHLLQTVKCLLIVPNPESALNEEAGKLLLEQYEDYFQRAKMMTEIHAKALHQVLLIQSKTRNCDLLSDYQAGTGVPSGEELNVAEGPTASKKAAPDRTVLADKKKPIAAKDKKRTLKRL